MATASGINKVVAYKKETVFGELATAVGGQTIRRVTSNFNLNKETYQSEEIREDYQIQDYRHGVRSVEGSISGELSAGAYVDFIASALARDWTAVAPAAPIDVTITRESTGMYSLTATDFTQTGIKVGMVVNIPSVDTEGNLLAVQVTDTEIKAVLLSSKPIQEGLVSRVVLGVRGKVTYAPNSGHTDDSYTFEEWYSDINQSEVSTGNKVNTLGIALPATGLTTVDIGFMGQDLKRVGTTQYFTSPSPQGSNGIFAAVNGALTVDGVPVALVTSLNININRNLTTESVVGSNINPEIYEGRIVVEGDFSTLFKDRTFSDYFNDEVEIGLVCALTESNEPDAEFITVTLPRIKLGTDTKDDGEKGIVAQNSFQALKGSGKDGFESTTIMVHDSSL